MIITAKSVNLESLIFIKRRDGGDSEGYDGSVGYIQYNQERDMRLMLIYQQMYNSMEKVYSFHVDKNPFQIMFEKGVGAKQRGSILPVKTTRYIRCDYDERDYNLFYNLAVMKDYGIVVMKNLLKIMNKRGTFCCEEMKVAIVNSL